MFKAMKRALVKHGGGGAGVDPSVFGDPLALRIDWSPAASGGASFRTHRLVQTSAHRIEFAPTVGAKLFYLLFLVIGSGLLVFQANQIRMGQGGITEQETFVPVLVGAVFAVAGACMYWFGTTPRVFDRTRAFFWRGRKGPEMMGAGGGSDSSVPLSSIHALQLLSEYVTGNKSSYYSYELNLVLDDGSRINVVDHGNLDRLRSDAETLSRFLDKPVWDATRS